MNDGVRPMVLDAASQTHQEAHHSTDQKHDEQYFRDSGSADGDSAETKKGSNQRNDEENDGIVKHECTYLASKRIGRLTQ
jgi:hypothetical protein